MYKKSLTIILLIIFLIGSVRVVFAQDERQSISIRLIEGWNLYSQPVVTRANPIFASELIKSMNLQNGLVSTISRYENGKYEDFVFLPNGESYGTDFQIEVGRAYWVLNYKEFTYHINGTPLSSWSTKLTPGFNFVAFPSLKNSTTVSDFASRIVKLSADSSPEISRFVSGLYESFAVKHGQTYGKNFTFDGYHGYIIRVDTGVNLDVK